jgi:hypothetical protein
MTKKIEVVVLDKQGYETDRWEVDTIREGKALAKKYHDPEYWDIRSEVKGYAKDNVDTIQLLVNNECHTDWFPKFK